MKKGLSGLFSVVALACCGMAFAAVDGMEEEKSATEIPRQEKPMPQESKKDKVPDVKLEAGMARPKDLDLRHCLELKDNDAIAKCAGE